MSSAVTAWIRQHATPLATTDPTAPLTDLAPLPQVVGDAQVVGLGESTHGAHEQFAPGPRASSSTSIWSPAKGIRGRCLRTRDPRGAPRRSCSSSPGCSPTTRPTPTARYGSPASTSWRLARSPTMPSPSMSSGPPRSRGRAGAAFRRHSPARPHPATSRVASRPARQAAVPGPCQAGVRPGGQPAGQRRARARAAARQGHRGLLRLPRPAAGCRPGPADGREPQLVAGSHRRQDRLLGRENAYGQRPAACNLLPALPLVAGAKRRGPAARTVRPRLCLRWRDVPPWRGQHWLEPAAALPGAWATRTVRVVDAGRQWPAGLPPGPPRPGARAGAGLAGCPGYPPRDRASL